MTTRIRTSIVAAVALLAIVAAPSAGAQVERSDDKSPAPMAGAVPLERVLAAVTKRAGKKFIVDPRVRADVTVVGQEPTSIDYPDAAADPARSRLRCRRAGRRTCT